MRVNAFIVEGDEEVVVVDTTLTMSDSKALKLSIDSLGKPIAGIIITHGHPDHVAGTYNIAPNGDVPIYALQSVNDLMAASEQVKHRQWSELFKEEWIPKWVYPNRIVKDGETVKIASLTFTVVDIGAGGDSDANSIWFLENDKLGAFVSDFIYNENHPYMKDGNILRWLANLARFDEKISQYKMIYVGHGPAADASLIEKQKNYFLTACVAALEATNGTAVFTEETKQKYSDIMIAKFPQYGFQLAVSLSADAVAKELLGIKNYNWQPAIIY